MSRTDREARRAEDANANQRHASADQQSRAQRRRDPAGDQRYGKEGDRHRQEFDAGNGGRGAAHRLKVKREHEEQPVYSEGHQGSVGHSGREGRFSEYLQWNERARGAALDHQEGDGAQRGEAQTAEKCR
jgi:hypothetical protein